MDSIGTYEIKESSKEFYGIENKKCPMCDIELDIAPISIVRLGKIGFCLSCYMDIPKNN